MGLALLHLAAGAAAVKLIPVSVEDDVRASRCLRNLHRLPGFAETSPTQRCEVVGDVVLWREPQGTSFPDHNSLSDPGLADSEFNALEKAFRELWVSPSSRDHTACNDQTRLLVLQPEATNPLQLYEMPEQLPNDHKLSLMPRHHFLAHCKLFQDHLVFKEALILPKSLEDMYTECARCGKAVPKEKMNSPCQFHPGQFVSFQEALSVTDDHDRSRLGD